MGIQYWICGQRAEHFNILHDSADTVAEDKVECVSTMLEMLRLPNKVGISTDVPLFFYVLQTSWFKPAFPEAQSKDFHQRAYYLPRHHADV